MIRENLVKEYCCEDISLIQNYQKAIEDSTQTWHCHHRLEIYDENGKERSLQKSRDELMIENRYYNRPASELIFLTKSEHRSLHMKHMGIYGYNHKKVTGHGTMYSKHLTDEQKKKLSEAHKGKAPWNKGKPMSEETKRKISESNKGKYHSEESKRKMSEAHKGIIKSNSISFEDIEFAKSHTNKECSEQKGWSANKCWRLRRKNNE